MLRGQTLDGLRLMWRAPSKQAIAAWPQGTRMVATGAGHVRVRDTGGTRPAIVMVPDGPCTIEHFDALFGELATSFRVVCFDLPGFGFSYPRPAYDFGLVHTKDVVIAVLDALEIRRATLSFSCGNGFYALATAKSAPERIERIVLCQTPSLDSMFAWATRSIPRPLRIPFLGQAVAALSARALARTWFDICLPRDSPDKQALRDQAEVVLRAGGCFCLASVVQGLASTRGCDLASIDVPTTMIWGDRDWSHKNTDFESFREHVRDCVVEVFEGCGHFPNLERPRAFAEYVRLWRP